MTFYAMITAALSWEASPYSVIYSRLPYYTPQSPKRICNILCLCDRYLTLGMTPFMMKIDHRSTISYHFHPTHSRYLPLHLLETLISAKLMTVDTMLATCKERGAAPYSSLYPILKGRRIRAEGIGMYFATSMTACKYTVE